VKEILAKSKPLKTVKKALPAQVDLRAWCSPIEYQGSLGSCTAQAGVGLLEYFQRRAFGKHLGGSRLFLYKATRQLAGQGILWRRWRVLAHGHEGHGVVRRAA